MDIKNISKLVSPLLVLPLALVAAGCSGNNEQACDGGKSISDPHSAVGTLLEAAETTDYDKACSAIILKLDEDVMKTQLKLLKKEMDSANISASDFTLVELERGGSAHFYNVYSEQPELAIKFTLIEVDEGYRVAFGEES